MAQRTKEFRLLTVHGTLNPERDVCEARLRNDLYLIGSLTLDYGSKGKTNIRLIGYEVPMCSGKSRDKCIDLLGYDQDFNPYIIELKVGKSSEPLDKIKKQIDSYEVLLRLVLKDIEKELGSLLHFPNFSFTSDVKKVILIPREYYAKKDIKRFQNCDTLLCSISRKRRLDNLLINSGKSNDVVLSVKNK